MNRASRTVHWTVLFLFICSLPIGFLEILRPAQAGNVGYTYSENFSTTAYKDNSNTTANWNANGAQLPYTEMPTDLAPPSQIDKPSDYIKSNMANLTSQFVPATKNPSDTDGVIYYFGGKDGSDNNIVLKYDTENKTYSSLSTTSTEFPSDSYRFNSTYTFTYNKLAYDTDNNKIYWFNSSGRIFQFDPKYEKFKSNTWNGPNDNGINIDDIPWYTINSIVTYIPNQDKIIIIGGLNDIYNSQLYSTIFSFSTNDFNLTKISDTLTLPSYDAPDTMHPTKLAGGEGIYYKSGNDEYIYIFGPANTEFSVYPNTLRYKLNDNSFVALNNTHGSFDYDVTDGAAPSIYSALAVATTGSVESPNMAYIYGGFSWNHTPSTPAINKVCTFDFASSVMTCSSNIMPSNSFNAYTANYDGSRIYFVGPDMDVVHENIPGTSSFFPIATLPESNFDKQMIHFSSAMNDNLIYFFGGWYGSSDIHKYNVSNNTMTLLGIGNQLNRPIDQAPSVYANGKYYIFGGANANGATVSSEVDISDDPDNISFTNDTTHPLTKPIRDGSAVYFDSNIYIFGYQYTAINIPPGQNNYGPEMIVYDINSKTSTPTNIDATLFPNQSQMQAHLYNGKIYIYGSESSGTGVVKYDPTANSFNDLGVSLASGSSVVDGRGNIYVFKDNSANSSIIKYNLVSGGQPTTLPVTTVRPRAGGQEFYYNDEIYAFGGADIGDQNFANEKMNLDYDLSKSLVQSKTINQSSDISSFTFSATPAQSDQPAGTSIAYEITTDGGNNWQLINSGDTVKLSPGNYDIRWKATLTGSLDVTPTISNVSINYFGTANKLAIAGSPSYHAGVANVSTISLNDSSGIATKANTDLNILLSSNSSTGYFANYTNSCQSDWNSSLTIPISEGDDNPVYFCYYNTSTGNFAITASANNLVSAIQNIVVDPGEIGSSTVTFSPPNPTVGNDDVDINVTLFDTSNNAMNDQTLVITSSRGNKDTITPAPNTTNGKTTGKIRSTVAGTATITVFDTTKNTYLPNKDITFLPDSVSKVNLTSNINQINAGNSFDLTATMYDQFNNLTDNTTDTLRITSSDPQAVLPSEYTMTSGDNKDNGSHTFSNLILKTAGPQTITVTDSSTGASSNITFTVSSVTPSASASRFLAVKFSDANGTDGYKNMKDSASDKAKLILDQDKLWLEVVITDQFGNPVKGEDVSIKFDNALGTIDNDLATTNDSGSASFFYTPKALGSDTLIATDATSKFDLVNKVSIEIVPNTPLNQTLSVISNAAKALQNSAIAKSIANIATSLVAATASLGLIPIIASVIGSAPLAAHAVTYAFSLGLEAVGIKKKRRSWGRVYDSTTGRGIDLALVRLYDQQTMKLSGTIVTDPKGQYHFQADPGVYVISVTKQGYIFPTQIFTKYGIGKINKNASRVNSHYVGQSINISSDNNFLNIEVPVDPVKKKVSTYLKLKIATEDVFQLATFGLSYIFIPTLIVGSVLSLFCAIVIPTRRNLVLAITYIIITLIYVISRSVKYRQFSVVVDAKSGKPIEGVVVSIFDKAYNTLRETRVSDSFGRFSIYAQPGSYYLKAEKSHYNFDNHSADRKKRKLKRILRHKDSYRNENATITLKRAGYIKVGILGRREK